MNKTTLFTVLGFSALVFAQQIPQNESKAEITYKELFDHISYLSSDELAGRFPGTKEIDEAAEYIAQDFKRSGLKPLFNGNYFQEFEVITGVELGGANNFSYTVNGNTQELQLNTLFLPLGISGNATVSAPVVFVGYGITATKLNYDDYEGIDVKGKIVLVMRSHPEGKQAHSQFDEFATLRAKTSNAVSHGAAAIVFVSGYTMAEEDAFVQLRYDGAPAIKGVPVIQIKRKVADELFAAEGKKLQQINSEIISNKKPQSFTLSTTFKVSTEVNYLAKKTKNVGAILEGNDPKLKDEYVVFGGHYDHLGYGYIGSLYRGKGMQIHNGADDNASGTAGVLELAEYFAANKGNKRSLIFLGFTAEEMGLLGSAYMVENWSVPNKQVAAMLNFDMIGRLKDKSLTVYGMGTSSVWKPLLTGLNDTTALKLSFIDDGFGASDHSSFYQKDIPVLFFFTGIHEDYHRPSDDAYKINAEGSEQVLKFAVTVANEIINSEAKPDFVKPNKTETTQRASFKVYVGTIPDYSYTGDGYKISGVSEGSPAQKAGMEKGDILVKLGTKKVANIYDYMGAMADFAPGDTTTLTVLRNGAEKTLNITFTGR